MATRGRRDEYSDKLNKRLATIVEGANGQKFEKVVDPRWIHHPTTGNPVCGAFKTNKKREYIQRGMSLEELVDNPELFEDFICCFKPLADPNAKGRCRFHAKLKRDKVNHLQGEVGPNALIKSSKYLHSLPLITKQDADLATLKAQHGDLNEELTILAHFVKDELPNAIGKQVTIANTDLGKKIKKMQAAFENFDMAKMKQILDDIDKLCEEGRETERAKQNVTRMIKDYTEVFNVEIKRRALTGEYVPKSQIIMSYRYMFTLFRDTIFEYLQDNLLSEKALGDVRGRFIRALNAGSIPGVSKPTNTDTTVTGFEDSDEGTVIDAVYTE